MTPDTRERIRYNGESHLRVVVQSWCMGCPRRLMQNWAYCPFCGRKRVRVKYDWKDQKIVEVLEDLEGCASQNGVFCDKSPGGKT